MKILNIIALLGLTTLPIVGCSKKEIETIISNQNETYEVNLEKVRKMAYEHNEHVKETSLYLASNGIENMPANIKAQEHVWWMPKSFKFMIFLENYPNLKKLDEKIKNFFKENGTKDNDIGVYYIEKLINVKIKFAKSFDLGAYLITSFSTLETN